MPSSGHQQRAACTELVTTEEAYLETLQTIVDVFLRPLRQWAAEDPAAGDAAAMD